MRRLNFEGNPNLSMNSKSLFIEKLIFIKLFCDTNMEVFLLLKSHILELENSCKILDILT